VTVEVDYAFLGISRQIGRALALIAESLQILLEKRTTLEEKMIRSYFLDLLPVQNSIAGYLIAKVRDNETHPEIDSNVISELTTLNEAIIEAMESFLKAARYDLNYLEQYFEHSFCEELQNSQWKERITELAAKISII
jgi:hypothetical protein